MKVRIIRKNNGKAVKSLFHSKTKNNIFAFLNFTSTEFSRESEAGGKRESSFALRHFGEKFQKLF